jgi:Ran GTPase-activating protein (RanGAP) involved in mRNA processing and transport
MKTLIYLDLSENEIGDVGINEIINSCKDYGQLEYLDLSGNNIGKTSFSLQCAETMYNFVSNNRNLEILKINWNNLRG